MKICFWGNIARALKGRTSGGGELQMALLAIALAKGGHEVVVLDYEITKGFTSTDGIKVMPIYGWNEGVRMLRTITHRLPQLYSQLVDQKANVYYCRIRDSRHLITYWAAKKVRAKFIMGLAEDLDVLGFRMRLKHHYLHDLHNLWGVLNGILIELIYPRLIRKSDFVFVQHEGQRQLLLKRGKKSILFPNMIDINKIPVVANPTHNYFIYVGWLDKHKGIVEFFNLVEKTPFANYVVIGPPRDKTGHYYYDKLKSYENVTLKGELCHSDTLHLIANSKALISTSHMEGFPNIFVEAWAYGVPVLSLYVDPGSIIETEKLGQVTHGNIEMLVQTIKDGISSEEFSKRAKTYVENHHVLNQAKIEEIRNLFTDLVNQGKKE